MSRILFAVSAALVAGALWPAGSAHADPPQPGCERVPIFGLNPQVRTICDGPIQADGSWMRSRDLHHPGYVASSCGGAYYQGGNCPIGMPHDVWQETRNDDTYRVTPDTIPPGEPGHLDGGS